MTAQAESRAAEARLARRVHLEGARKQALETGRNRLLVAGAVISFAFAVVALRVVDLAQPWTDAATAAGAPAEAADAVAARGAIVDRNGLVLAASLPTRSLYADPANVMDAEEAATRLVATLPGLDRDEVLRRLTADSRFEWLKRHLTPNQIYAVNSLGLPGIGFRESSLRVYPQGRAAAHVLGRTDVDGHGVSGSERAFDDHLRRGQGDLALSIDIRLQTLMHEVLADTLREFRAKGAAGVIQDVRTGEVLAMVSLPDYDPNAPQSPVPFKDPELDPGFNRAAKGVYEMGSTFKLFTAAMALDSGTVGLTDGYDASEPIKVSRYRIRDYHPQNRWLTVPEILVYSSNIGTAKMAMDVGAETQRRYLTALGLMAPAGLELPEVGKPLLPATWRDINTMTISYGHGIAVSPLQLSTAVSTVVNGGLALPPTILRRDPANSDAPRRVLSAETSRAMRSLMRLVVTRGTGRNADVPGLRVGGKTGTAEKLAGGRYQSGQLVSSFVGAFPMDDPRYVVLAVVDEPKGLPRTQNFATGGWVAAPAVRRVIAGMAPLVGIPATAGDPGPPGAAAALRISDGRGKGRRGHGHEAG